MPAAAIRKSDSTALGMPVSTPSEIEAEINGFRASNETEMVCGCRARSESHLDRMNDENRNLSKRRRKFGLVDLHRSDVLFGGH